MLGSAGYSAAAPEYGGAAGRCDTMTMNEIGPINSDGSVAYRLKV